MPDVSPQQRGKYIHYVIVLYIHNTGAKLVTEGFIHDRKPLTWYNFMRNLLIVSKFKMPGDLKRGNGREFLTSTFNKY